MASYGASFYSWISGMVFGAGSSSTPKAVDSTPFEQQIPFNADRYRPTKRDVLAVKRDLMERFRLPLELMDTIIDQAEYWPHVATLLEGTHIRVRAGGPSEHENRFMLRSYPLGFIPGHDQTADYQMTDQYQASFTTLLPQPWAEDREIPSDATNEVLQAWSKTTRTRSERPCRKIVFTITSHDQGWGGGPTAKGQYDGSFTWFDVGKEELSAFEEHAVLEAWEIAPWPQFRLHYTNKNAALTASSSTAPFKDPSPLVCSLRTVVPSTIPKTEPAEQSDGEEDAEQDEDNSNVQAPQGSPTPRQRPAEPRYQFRHDLCPTSDVLQKNVVAERKSKTHTITWSCDDKVIPESQEGDELDFQGRGRNTGQGDYVRNLKLGDCITVWAKARFQGWVNVIEKIEIDVYWAV